MTNDTVFVLAVSLSIITVVGYLICRKTKAQLPDAIVIFLSCSGLVTGIQIGCLTLGKTDLGPLKDYKLYLIIGGFAVIWLSIQAIIKCFK
jgi:hypothetical protein